MPFCLISFWALVLLVLKEWDIYELELLRSIYSFKKLLYDPFTLHIMQALKYFSTQKQFDKLVETSMISLAKDGGSDDGFSLSSAIVNFVLQRDGLGSARELYKRYVTAD